MGTTPKNHKTGGDKSRPLHQEVFLLLVGLAIGIISTAATQFIKEEYNYSRNLRIVRYWKACKAGATRCVLRVKAYGRETIPTVRIEVSIATIGASIINDKVILKPSMFPPTVHRESTPGRENELRNLVVKNFREPQEIMYEIEVSGSQNTSDEVLHIKIIPEGQHVRVSEAGFINLPVSASVMVIAVLLAAFVISAALALYFYTRHAPRV